MSEKCEGCKYGFLNQLGHMDEGGCLEYDIKIEENESTDKIEKFDKK